MLVIDISLFCLADDVAREASRAYTATEVEQPNWDTWVVQVRAIYAIGMLGSAAAVVASLGLFAERHWGRKCWLAVTAFFVLYHGIWWIFDRGDWITLAVVAVVAMFSWMDLTKAENRRLFT